MNKAAVIIFFFCSSLGAQNQASISRLYDDTSLFHISKLIVNSHGSDFGVTVCADEFVFTSSRDDRMMVRYFNSDGSNPYGVWSFKKSDSGYTQPSVFAGELRSKSNRGPVSFSRDGKTMIITGNSPTTGNDQKHALALFESHQVNGKWSEPELLPFCNNQSNYMHPCLSMNDSVLLFTSDQPGGAGGTDIWMVRRADGKWSAPQNAGEEVNSTSNESFPFLSAQHVLYFSSNRPGGVGGLDLYALNWNAGEDCEAEHLPGIINSTADDFAMWLSEDQNSGFFSSNRDGDDNIYAFRFSWPAVLRADTLVKPQLCYTFFEEATEFTKDTVKTKYIWTFSDAEQLTGYTVYKCFDSVGVYPIHLEIRDSSAGDMIVSKVDYEFDVSDPNYTEFVAPDTVSANAPFRIDASYSGVDGYSVENVYYDFGNGFRSKGLQAEHIYRKPGIYYPGVYMDLKNKSTGAHEGRCIVKPIVVL